VNRPPLGKLTRRAALASTLALAACGRTAKSEPQIAAPPLKSVARLPIGCSVMTGQLNEPAFAGLLSAQVSQLTPEWEMKMEYILQADGSFRFDAPDAIAAFARSHGMKLHGHTLVWYAQDPEPFKRVSGPAFETAYRNYILVVAGRYRGQCHGWDVVNEPIMEHGEGLRSSLWSQRLGDYDHIVRAFDHAAEADPGAVLFLNDYNLESRPAKRVAFMRLVEQLLKRGCKLGGLGSQTHIDIDLDPLAVPVCLKDLASFGLPVHLSELDISTNMKKLDVRSSRDKLRLQARQAQAAAEAFMALPARQRYAFTLWGLRDKDSWLRGSAGTGPADQPTLFDDAGQPKPAFEAVSSVFSR
jgi:endo-1,4-beta-xylanase